MTEQLTIHKTGLIGKAYQYTPFPFGGEIKLTSDLATKIRLKVTLP